MNVIGLDLSLAATGYSFAGGEGTVKTNPKVPLGARLDDIRNAVADLHERCFAPRLWVIEDLPHHVAHGGPQLGMVHGVVRWWLWEHCEDVVLVPPASLKTFATGKGNAKKPDIRMEVFKRYAVDLADDNQCDAFVLRAMGSHHCGAPLAELPATHLRGLDKVEWPLGVQERAREVGVL